jgi:hypothetical protein
MSFATEQAGLLQFSRVYAGHKPGEWNCTEASMISDALERYHMLQDTYNPVMVTEIKASAASVYVGMRCAITYLHFPCPEEHGFCATMLAVQVQPQRLVIRVYLGIFGANSHQLPFGKAVVCKYEDGLEILSFRIGFTRGSEMSAPLPHV